MIFLYSIKMKFTDIHKGIIAARIEDSCGSRLIDNQYGWD